MKIADTDSFLFQKFANPNRYTKKNKYRIASLPTKREIIVNLPNNSTKNECVCFNLLT